MSARESPKLSSGMVEVLETLEALAERFGSGAKQLDSHLAKFQTLSELAELSSRVSDLEQLLALVLKKAMSATGARIGTVMLARGEGDGLEIAAREGWTPSLSGPIDPRDTLVGKVIRTGEPLLVEDLRQREDLLARRDADPSRPPSFLIAPLKTAEATIGAVCLSDKPGAKPFTPEDQRFLTLLLAQIGCAVEIARRLKLARESSERLAEKIKEQELRLSQARRQIQRAGQMASLGTMLAGVAHELSNPLAAILGRAEMLLDAQGGDSPPLRTIHSEALRARRILESLLSAARASSGEMRIVNFNKLVVDIATLRGYELRNRDIDLSTDLDPDLPLTPADPEEVQRVLLELVSNSVEAMPVQGTRQIRIGTHRVGEKICLWIADTGRGIPETIRERIFEPFFSTSADLGHCGLGLTFTRDAMTRHGGEVLVDSFAGRGTRITLLFPILAPSFEQVSAPPEGALEFPLVSNRVAVVIDDEAPIAEMVGEMLSAAGFQVEILTDGKEALRRLLHEDFDVAVCDLIMPEMDGRTLYRRILKVKPEAASRFVFITGDTADPQTPLFAKNNRARLVTKPFTRRELLREVYRTPGLADPAGDAPTSSP